MRRLTAVVSKTNCVCIFTNQIREKIGVMFGSPETTTGGRALKFYSSARIDIRRISSIKDGDKVVGNRTKVRIVKNKVAPPFRDCEFDILFGKGISREGDLLDLGVANNIVEKSGAWYSYAGERIGQGRENTRRFLKDNPEIFSAIDKAVREKMKVGQQATAPVVEVPPPAPEVPIARTVHEVPASEAAPKISADASSETEDEPLAIAS
jgi:recombination protein RecA